MFHISCFWSNLDNGSLYESINVRLMYIPALWPIFFTSKWRSRTISGFQMFWAIKAFYKKEILLGSKRNTYCSERRCEEYRNQPSWTTVLKLLKKWSLNCPLYFWFQIQLVNHCAKCEELLFQIPSETLENTIIWPFWSFI